MTTESTSDRPHGEILISRTFDAPRALVFAAWTDPVQLTQWWGPAGFTTPVCEVDVRPGGRMHIVMRDPSGADYPMIGVFREVVPSERIVFTWQALDAGGNTLLDGTTTVTFSEEGGSTTITVEASADGMTAAAGAALGGMQAGWTQTLERLEAFVAAGR